jgi:hypothetical protein
VNIRVVVAIDHPVGGFGPPVKIERDGMALAAQFLSEVEQITLAVDDAAAALQGPDAGAEVESGRMHGDAARL